MLLYILITSTTQINKSKFLLFAFNLFFYLSDKHKPQSTCHIVCKDTWCNNNNRRHVIASGGVSILAFNYGLPLAWAENEQEEKDESLVGAFKSLFDPNEKTKSGKVLPKAYLNSAREVVKTLRESLNEDPNDMAKFRRTADAAKASIREYLGSWRGEKTVINEVNFFGVNCKYNKE